MDFNHVGALRWGGRILLFLLVCYLVAMVLNATLITAMLADSKGVWPDDICEQLGAHEPVPEGLLDTRPLGWSCGLRLEALPAFLLLVPLVFLPAVVPLLLGGLLVARLVGRTRRRPERARRLSKRAVERLAETPRVLLVPAACYGLSFLVNLPLLLAPWPTSLCSASDSAEAFAGFVGVIYLGIGCELYWGDPLAPLDPLYLIFGRPLYFMPVFVPAGSLLFLVGQGLLRLARQGGRGRAAQ